MAGWHQRLEGHEVEWTLGVGDGQGGLACSNSWGCKESDMTEWLNWTELNLKKIRLEKYEPKCRRYVTFAWLFHLFVESPGECKCFSFHGNRIHPLLLAFFLSRLMLSSALARDIEKYHFQTCTLMSFPKFPCYPYFNFILLFIYYIDQFL